jgi:transcriptional regulator with XRE-family HTH domain
LLNTARPTPDIGARLREAREARGLSQRELARRTGVTNGMISLIEQDKVSPSIASLKRVLGGLAMTLGDFFAAERPAGEQIFFRAAELMPLAEGALSFRQVGADLRGRKIQILHERYAPGADTGEAMLQHEAEEGGIVLRGRVEITVGRELRILGPGDAYYFDSRAPHRFRNIGDEECEIISACSPPSF